MMPKPVHALSIQRVEDRKFLIAHIAGVGARLHEFPGIIVQGHSYQCADGERDGETLIEINPCFDEKEVLRELEALGLEFPVRFLDCIEALSLDGL